MYAYVEKHRERNLIQNIEDIQIKTILLYKHSDNMPNNLLKDLTFALASINETIDNGVAADFDYNRVIKILEHLINYMKDRIVEKHELIENQEFSLEIVELKDLCNVLEEKLTSIDSVLYEKEILFIKNYKLYLLNLDYFLSDFIV
jgi:hypothetical protein